MNLEEAQALVAALNALPWPDRDAVKIYPAPNNQEIRQTWEVEIRHETQGILRIWWGSALLDALAVALKGWLEEAPTNAE